jgi:DNA-binding transcriptional regulator GbsR (MarR family)
MSSQSINIRELLRKTSFAREGSSADIKKLEKLALLIDSSELGNVSQKVDEAEINYRKNVARRVQEEAQKSVQNLREVLRSIQRDRQEENKLKEIAENQKVQQQLSSLENQINNS